MTTNQTMTVETALADMAEVEQEAKDELQEEWGCDTVDVGENTIVLSWNNGVEEAGENTKALSEELYTVAEKNPNAQVQAFADSERFTIQVQVN